MKRSWWDCPMGSSNIVSGDLALTPRELLNAVLAFGSVMSILFAVTAIIRANG